MRTLLVANRGEIARRVIRAAREMGLRTAVVHSDPDADALFVADADESVRLPGSMAADTYLNADAVVAAALRVGADAVHPGYGFLSENAAFARMCTDAGLVFVGPPADAIRRMGDKVAAKALMAASGVPTLPGFTVREESDEELDARLRSVGLPAIVKASAGGGGRGMRIVEDPDKLLEAVESARREALAAFGDGTVFVERYLSPSRHIEVQIVADDHGQVVALHERECSVQRRHQKVVEEAPSPFVDAELRGLLTAAAVNAARAVDYRGVGTVEFVVGTDRTVAFLEMNTRLQVEHPVTELVTGVDLVQLQLAVAMGRPIPPEVCNAPLRGHAVEARLCAEDPAQGYLPASGTFDVFELGGPGVRVDTGVATGSVVSPYYDSMVAKVIAWAPDRAGAAARLADALERARLHGVPTNRDVLVRVLRSAEFLDGDTTTDFIQRVPGLLQPLTAPETHTEHAVVAALAWTRAAATERSVQLAVPTGWRNNRTAPEPVRISGDADVTVGCDLSRAEIAVTLDGVPLEVEVHALGSSADVTIRGVRRRYAVTLLGQGRIAVDSARGSSDLTVAERLPLATPSGTEGGLTAPMPGAVVRVLVELGQVVTAGQPLVVLEAMKMEHTILSPAAGSVTTLAVGVGDQVERGAVLAAVAAAPDDPSGDSDGSGGSGESHDGARAIGTAVR